MAYTAESRKESDFQQDFTPANNYIIGTNNVNFWSNKMMDWSSFDSQHIHFLGVDRLVYYQANYNSFSSYNARQTNMLYGLYLVIMAQDPKIYTEDVILLSFD